MLIKNEYSRGLDWVKETKLSHLVPAYSTPRRVAYHADSINVLKALPPNCIDLVMTSPPFALTRQKEYGNESIERYYRVVLAILPGDQTGPKAFR